jgi:hypothetical protein
MSRFFSAFGTAFVAMGFICAPLAAFFTFVLYVWIPAIRGGVAISVIGGLAVGVVAALFLGFIYTRRYQAASDVNAEQFHDIKTRLLTVKSLRDACIVPTDTHTEPYAALAICNQLIAGVQGLLAKKGPVWLSAEGYLEIWNDIYGAEESLVLLVLVQQVIAMANYDRSRLEGSSIANAASLAKDLLADVQRLSPPDPSAKAGKDELTARLDVQMVRRQINRYRSDQWKALVGERNRTLLAAAFAGAFVYLGLLSVVIWNINPRALLVAVSFVITGALVSLLHQVTWVGTADTGIEDFGQSVARLLTATFVSGIIALIGIIVLEGASLTVNGAPLLTPYPHWYQTFDWTMNKSGFFFAALFGFTPSLLFDLLQKRADTIKGKLDSSQATGAAPQS